MGYEVIYYKDNKLESPVGEFIEELISRAETNKESKQLLRKIRHSYKLLERFGTRIGLPHVRHIEDEIWELRPKGQRILFFTWKGDKIVLLSHLKKEKNKIPRREIDKAKRRMNDWFENGEERQKNCEEVKSMDWKDHKEKIDAIISEEAEVSDLILDLIERRLELGLTQKELEERTGIKQPAIARIESEGVVPNIETVINLARAMGLKLTFEKLESENKEKSKRKLVQGRTSIARAQREKRSERYTINYKLDFAKDLIKEKPKKKEEEKK